MSPRTQYRIDTAMSAAAGGLVPVLGLLGLLVGFGDRIWLTKDQFAQHMAEITKSHSLDVATLTAADASMSQWMTRIDACTTCPERGGQPNIKQRNKHSERHTP